MGVRDGQGTDGVEEGGRRVVARRLLAWLADGGDMPRVLFVSYLFPPVGGAGVQRVAKWVKYLPSHGWSVSVLTTSNPSVPVLDPSLEAEIPEGVLICRARTLEPGYGVKGVVGSSDSRRSGGGPRRLRSLVRRCANAVLQPDPQILWAPAALAEGRRVLESTPHDVVVATGPPFSALLVGARLARRAGLPLVLDFRDEWGISNRYYENRPKDLLSNALQRRMQDLALRRAVAVLATTERSTAALRDACRAAGSRATACCIYNGYDHEDFAVSSAPPASGGPFRLSYVGTLWALTDVRPLAAAVTRLAKVGPESAAALELEFAGRRTPDQELAIEGLRGLPTRVITHGYVSHSGAIELMSRASGLCLLLADAPEAARVVPAKLFEYMAARRPVLSIAPPGETQELLLGHPAARRCDPRDVDGIVATLREMIAEHQRGDSVAWGAWDPSRFSRARLTFELAELLRSVTRGD